MKKKFPKFRIRKTKKKDEEFFFGKKIVLYITFLYFVKLMKNKFRVLKP